MLDYKAVFARMIKTNTRSGTPANRIAVPIAYLVGRRVPQKIFAIARSVSLSILPSVQRCLAHATG